MQVWVRVTRALYKLMQGALLLMSLEQFAIGKSTVYGVVKDVVHAINKEF